MFYIRDIPKLEFEDITIFYGGNGSGKSTILNVIAEKLRLERDSVFNRSNFYDDYVKVCRFSLMPEYTDLKYSQFRLRSLEDLDQLKKSNRAKSESQSSFVRQSVMDNILERSNGESAFLYFTSKIRQNALYILDESENSLSSKLQKELKQFITDSMRSFRCQFIIATHSPFMLSIPGAKIYDLDNIPPAVRRWTELEAMRDHYELFIEHREAFAARRS